MSDITLIFDLTKGSASKDRAIKIAERYEIYKEKDTVRVIFHKYSADLLTLLEICKKWDTSELLIDNQEYRFPDALKILKCANKSYCEGFCQKGNGLDFSFKEEIENASKGIYDEFSDPESIRQDLSQIKGITKEKDGSYHVDKNELKKNLLIDYNLPLQICEKIDRERMLKYIDQFPDSFNISDDVIEVESEFEGLSDYQIGEFKAQADVMGSIIAKHVAREIDKVFIANLGPEKDALSCERKGDCLFELGRYDESVDCFDKALTFDSKNKGVLFGKAIALYYNEKYQDVLPPLDAYLAIESNNPRAWKLKGEILENLGKYEESVKNYERSLAFFSQELREEPDREDNLEEIEFVNQKIKDLQGRF